MIFLTLVMAGVFSQQKVILDTDIADDIDDAYALGLLLRIPDIKLLGVTTAFGDTAGRAKVAAKLLKEFDRNDVPVYAGRSSSVPIRGQFAWAKDFSAKSIKTDSAIEFMKREINRAPKQITIIAVGPLTNLGDLITKYPDVTTKIKQVVIMGGSFYVGYNNQPPVNAEWNIYCDPAAARLLFHSGIPVVCAGLEVTTMMQFDGGYQQRLSATNAKGTAAITELKNLWGTGTPTLFDPVTVAYATGFRFGKEEMVHVDVDDQGVTRVTEGSPKVAILIQPQRKEFLDWYVSMYAPVKSEEYRKAISIRQPVDGK